LAKLLLNEKEVDDSLDFVINNSNTGKFLSVATTTQRAWRRYGVWKLQVTGSIFLKGIEHSSNV